MAWTYNQASTTYNQAGNSYNGVVAAIKAYATGGIMAAKRMLRGFGF